MKEAEFMRIMTDYIKKNLKKGYTVDSLRWALVGQGYSRTAIEKALQQVHKELAEEVPAIKEKPQITREIISEEPVKEKKSFWKKLFG